MTTLPTTKTTTVLSSLILLVLFIATVVSASSPRTCSALSAVGELRTESFYNQYISDLQPIVAATGVVYASTNLQLLHVQNLDMNKFVRQPRATRVIRMDMAGRASSSVISDKFFKSVFTKNKTTEHDAYENPNALLWSMSNVVNVDYDLLTKQNSIIHTTAGLTASSLLIPNQHNTEYSDIHFLFFDAQSEEIEDMKNTFGSIAFSYPFETGVEKIFNEHGDVVADQVSDIEQSAVNLKDDVTGVAQSSQDNTIRLRVLNAGLAQQAISSTVSFYVNFATVITTQNSTKFIIYRATTEGAAVKSLDITSKSIIIPRVESSDNFNFVSNGNLGARIEVDNKTGRIFAVATLNKRQVSAFKKLHVIEFEYPADAEDVVVLIEIHPQTARVVSVENLTSKIGLKQAYATGLDIKGTRALITGNSDNFGRSGKLTEHQTPFVSIVDFSEHNNVDTVDLGTVTQNDKSKQRFVALSGVFAANGLLDEAGDAVAIGGAKLKYDATHATDGTVVLIDLYGSSNTSTTPKQLYDLRVGYSKSNAVTTLKRSFLKAPIDAERYKLREEYLLGCVFDAPNTAEPSGRVKALKFRTVHSGVWQVDCAKENMKVRQGFTITFYILFGINTSILLVVIIYNSIKCGLDYRQAKLEEERLIMEGHY